MARPALRKVARPEEADGPRLARLDRDRPLVDAARTDPARFDALYRKYLAQVYNFAVYELGDHHEAVTHQNSAAVSHDLIPSVLIPSVLRGGVLRAARACGNLAAQTHTQGSIRTGSVTDSAARPG